MREAEKRRWGAALCGIWLAVSLGLAGSRLGDAAYGVQGDLSLHYHIARSYSQSLSEGDWRPRWAGVLDGGWGDALFTFYPPLSYLVSGLLMRLPGVDALGSLKILSVLILFLGQAGGYLLARRFFDRRASLLAGVAYVALPGYALIGLNRNFLANAMGLALAPLVMRGAYGVLVDEERVRSGVILALSASGLVLSHLLTTYLCGIAVGGMALLFWPRTGWRGPMRLAAAGVLVFGLTAFFLAPQQIERSWVHLDLQLIRQDYRNYLLFAQPAEGGAYRRMWTGLNLVISLVTALQVALSLLLTAGVAGRRRSGPPVAVMVRWGLGMTLLALLISLPGSEPIWERVPGLRFIQFPWRALPFVSLGSGLAAAALWTVWGELPRGRRLWLAPLLGLTVAANLFFTWMVVRRYDVGLSGPQVAETLTAPGVGKITFAESLEIQRQENGDRRMLAYTANQPYFRPATADLDYYPPAQSVGGLTVLDGRCRVTPERLGNEDRVFLVECESAAQARIETYHYPHWVARIDDAEVGLETEPERGRMRLGLPAGRHRLRVRFEPRNRVEQIANGLSLLTWGLFAAWMIRRHTHGIFGKRDRGPIGA
ncbi:MAG: 6-pyruvoyl-tetrahydropterin synthase-related protein [Blastocatellia bacterium]|nr:6-pyruvoyl-tetrahydropterin synthase-related protein [Blastocatellia bacterium]